MPSTEEDYIQNEYYAYNHRLFRLIGLWEYQRSSKKLIYVCFINLVLMSAIFEQIYLVIKAERKLNSYREIVEVILPIIGAVSCYYNLISNAAIMKKIFYRINYDWNKLSNKRELIILKNYAKLSRKCTVAMIIVIYLNVGFLMFSPLLSIIRYHFGTISYNELVLPVHFDLPIKNYLDYYLIFWHQCIIISIICTVGAASYSMFIGIILHCCALFNVVVWKINERFKENRNNYTYDIENVNLSEENEWIVDVIEFYKTVIEFVSHYNSLPTTNLFEGFLALLLIMIDYYYVLSFNINKTEGLAKLSFVIGSLFIIFAYFYLGQKLIDHSNKVFLTICQIPFYLLSLRTQKIMLFFTMRSMGVCNLSWQGAIVVSHNLFTMKSLSFAMINAIFMSERELNSIAKLLETTLPTLCSGSCYYNLISNAAIMKKIFYRMRRDWIDLANKPEVIILEKYAKLSRLCTIVIISIWRINERFKENRNNNYCDGDKVKLSEENEWVVGIIRFYKYSIEFVDLMKSFYEATHLCEWSLAMLFITIDYFYVFSTDANTTGVLTKLSYVIPSMFLFFAYFYLGQKLIDHSDNVFLTIVSPLTKLLTKRTIVFETIKNNKRELFELAKSAKDELENELAEEYHEFFREEKENLKGTSSRYNVSHSRKTCQIRLCKENETINCQIPFYSLSLKSQKILLFFIMETMRIRNLSLKGVIVICHSTFSAWLLEEV
ncbi:odorant receptor 46a-like isoform X1 [Vespula maculifrons]|uniref:Odorant receptor 46a-like isoform X1 n=1 Tax=Vespula maculifrons TaxID=7453 RepID=A0ABD2BPC6_VESMC